MTLYDIGAEYQRFMAAVEAGEIPEEAIGDTLEGIQGEFEVKADSIACLVKQLRSDVEAIKAEADNLAARARAKAAYADRLARYLHAQMRAVDKAKLETARNRIMIKKTPVACVSEDTDVLPCYLQMQGMEDCIKRETSIKKREVMARLKDGTELPGVHLEAGERLEIK